MKTLLALSYAVALAGGARADAPPSDPLLQPVAEKDAAKWLAPQPPLHIYGNTYLVGFHGLSVGLIRTDAGLILIDGALPQGVRAIENNIHELGLDVRDVKLILSTEPHFDHASGLAALARDSGATVISSVAAAPILRSGKPDASDPQFAWLSAYPGVSSVRSVRNGEKIKLGNTIVTARATPGHTAGSMSWIWRSCEERQCLSVVFSASLTPLGAPGYRFSAPEHAAALTNFRKTFDIVRTFPCDILLTSHPDASGGDEKASALAKAQTPNPFVDSDACRAYSDDYRMKLDKRLAEEASGQVK
jgi:metallo-beta-lactamase class B